jgi:hypothetical protein
VLFGGLGSAWLSHPAAALYGMLAGSWPFLCAHSPHGKCGSDPCYSREGTADSVKAVGPETVIVVPKSSKSVDSAVAMLCDKESEVIVSFAASEEGSEPSGP